MEIEIYGRAIITILGMAYPFILQVIAKLDQSYSSTVVIELLEKEPEKIYFERLLYFSLFVLMLWTFKLEPKWPFDKLGFLVDNSACMLVIISCIALVISFIRFVKLLFVYYNPVKFTDYLIKKHNEIN